MKLLRGHDAQVTHWVCENIPHLAVRIPYFDLGQVLGPTTAFGVLNDEGQLVAGVVFHGYDPFVRAIEVSCAAIDPKWATRNVIGEILRYAFEGAQCIRISAATPKRSTSPRRFLEGIGFRREGSVRRGFGDDSAIIYSLLAEDWAIHPLNRARVPSASDERSPTPPKCSPQTDERSSGVAAAEPHQDA